ncbi:MAG TPA: hypothetical protein VLC71_05245 [Thermomonas sp.]|nr:hypothetical protein [Thermomonas sp.]
MPDNTRPSPTPAILLWAGMALCATGLAAHRTWTELPFPRAVEHGLLAVLALAAAWPLRRWRRWTPAAALALAWLLALIVYAGPMPVLATAVLAATAIGMGSLLMPGPVALPLGLAMIAGTLGWSLSLPIHHRAVYALACLAIVAWRGKAILDIVQAAGRGLEDDARASPRAARGALLLLGLASTAAWLPTMQPDDVAYHLGLPAQLQATAHYAMDARLQVWALAPWNGDVLQGVVQVLAGRESRGALNALWLLAAAGAMHGLATALGGDAQRRWWAVALMASLPLTMHLATGMQTELVAMAWLPALAWLVLRNEGESRPRTLFAGALLFGALCGLKPMHGLVALPVLAWAAWRHRAALRWRWLAMAAVLAAITGGASYVHAWLLTGNPVLPLFNGWFRSPFFPLRDFQDPRWNAGLGIDDAWGITFDTGRYLEAHAGGFGFVLIAMLGVWLLALRHARTRALAVVASSGLLLTLLPLQYARYLQPSLVLLLPALVVAWPRVRHGAVAFWSLCVLNLAFATNANWMLRTGALKRDIASPTSDATLFLRYAPERLLAARLPQDKALVLVMPGNYGALAELGQRGRNVSWYSPAWEAEFARVDADASGQAWASLLQRERIGHVILDMRKKSAALGAGLALADARLADSAGDSQRWSLPVEAQR